MDLIKVIHRPAFIPSVITIYGLGGIGGNFFNLLVRYVKANAYLSNCMIRLVDADTISESNLERQPFMPHHIGKLKVSVLRTMNSMLYSNIAIVPEYIDVDNIQSEIAQYENTPAAVFICVDNDYTRKVLIEGYKNSRKSDFMIFMGGNKKHTGDVVTFGRIKNRWIGIDPIEVYPNIGQPADFGPGTHRCDDAPLQATPVDRLTNTVQLLTVNADVALSMLQNLNRMLVDPEGRFFGIVNTNHLTGMRSTGDMHSILQPIVKAQQEAVEQIEEEVEAE